MNDRGIKVPDLSFAGGFAREDHLFKPLHWEPFTKIVCLGQHPIAGFLGSNIEAVLNPERKSEIERPLESLPPTVTEYGKYPKIFSGMGMVKNKIGEKEMKKVPYGAVAVCGYADKIAGGLQQFEAGARKFNLAQISRSDLISSNHETAELTGIPLCDRRPQ
jgi:hypothetical protein